MSSKTNRLIRGRFIYELWACGNHYEDARRLQARGTKCVTLDKPERAKVARHIDNFDEFLELRDLRDFDRDWLKFVRGEYTDAGFTGLFCLQYAINHGATHVAMVGMEGYRSEHGNPCNENFHDPKHRGRVCGRGTMGRRHTERIIGPFTQSCIDTCPDIRFIFYGNPTYKLSGFNLIHCHD